MPLCNYFINGNCRFGSKCNNDHIDLKALLRTEVEAVLNGKQWILSCFGPFKESSVVPNFINDQSFEEVRVGYLESSKNGNIQGYINNLLSEYNLALQKLNDLKMPSTDTLQIIAQIYNNSTDQKNQTVKPSITQQKPNPFQSANIFGGQQQQTMSSSSIFGNSSISNNPFQNTQSKSASIFGSSTTMSQPSSSPFSFAAGTTQQSPQSNIFTQNIFGSTNQPLAQTSTSIFNSGSQFGVSNTQQQLQTPSSIFGLNLHHQQSPTANTQPQNLSNIFGQSSFSQPITQSSSSVFGTPQMKQNIFQQVQQSTANIFGGQQMPQVSEISSSSNNFAINNSFQQLNQTQPIPKLFQQQEHQTVNNIFNQQQQNVNPFQQQMQTMQLDDEKFYSKPEEISVEDGQAFKAETFIYGQIPINPPAKSFCIQSP